MREIDKHNLITRTRYECELKLIYYNTITHNRFEKPFTLVLQGAEDPLKAAWEKAEKGTPPEVLADVQLVRKRKVTYYMEPAKFYELASKHFEN